MTERTEDDVAKALAEFERLAIASGQWAGTDLPEFSTDGQEWVTVWEPTDAHPHPLWVRATVYRKDLERPVTVLHRWAEAIPTDEAQAEEWLRQPTIRFGAFGLRGAYRRGFGDVIQVERPESPARDWDAEIAAASSMGDLQRLWDEMKTHRARTAAREKACHARRDALIEAGEPVRLTMSERIDKLATGGVVQSAPVAAVMPSPVPRPPSAAVHRLEDIVLPVAKPGSARKGQSRAQRDSGKRRES